MMCASLRVERRTLMCERHADARGRLLEAKPMTGRGSELKTRVAAAEVDARRFSATTAASDATSTIVHDHPKHALASHGRSSIVPVPRYGAESARPSESIRATRTGCETFSQSARCRQVHRILAERSTRRRRRVVGMTVRRKRQHRLRKARVVVAVLLPPVADQHEIAGPPGSAAAAERGNDSRSSSPAFMIT